MPWLKQRGIGVAASLAAAGVASLAGAAAGQNEWRFDVAYSDPAGVINSLDDTVTVTLWAAFDPNDFAFRIGEFDATADDPIDAGLWSGVERLLKGPDSLDGTIEGETVVGAIASQVYWPNNIWPDTSNPIAAWTASWSTTDLQPRNVRLSTITVAFGVYLDAKANLGSHLDSLQEGEGIITIVPASDVWLPLALAGPWAFARRRRSLT